MVGTVFLQSHRFIIARETLLVDWFFSGASSAVCSGPFSSHACQRSGRLPMLISSDGRTS